MSFLIIQKTYFNSMFMSKNPNKLLKMRQVVIQHTFNPGNQSPEGEIHFLHRKREKQHT